jgi:hypothetical protein
MPPSPNGTQQVAIFIIHLYVSQIQRMADMRVPDQIEKDEL